MLQMIQGWDDTYGETEPGFDNQDRGYIPLASNLTRFGVGGAAAFGSPYNEKYYNVPTPASTLIIGSAVKIPRPYEGATPPGYYYYNFLGLCWTGSDYQGFELILAGGTENRLHVRTPYAAGPDVSSGGSYPTDYLVPYDLWFYVEMKARMASDNTGMVEVRVNGSTVFEMTGRTQRIDGAAKLMNKGYISNCGIQTFHDDTYICDTTGSDCNDFLGDVRVAPLRPNAPGLSAQFTSSDGNPNWDAANGSYGRNLITSVSPATAGLTDLYNVTNMVGTDETIEVYGVQVVGVVDKDGPDISLLTRANGATHEDAAAEGPSLRKITFDTLPAGLTSTGGAPTIVNYSDLFGDTQNAIACADLGDGTNTSYTFSFTVTEPSLVAFRYYVSSEQNYDFGSITLDSTQVVNASGTGVGWTRTGLQTVTTGTHTVTVRFTKDSSGSSGFDNIYLGSVLIGNSADDFGAATLVGPLMRTGALQTTDPAGQPWTASSVNAMQIGVKST